MLNFTVIISFLDEPSESDFPPFRGFVASCQEDSPRGKSGVREGKKVRLLPLYKTLLFSSSNSSLYLINVNFLSYFFK